MASFSFLSFPVYVLSLSSLWMILLISPSHSLNCTAQKFANNKLYNNCTDLPTLNASLHYTYNASNSSLSIAFKAPPATPNGWVSWALNLNDTGMAGAQALVAMKSSKDAVLVKKYDIKSYSEVNETPKLAFDVWDVSGESESSSGDFVIYASVKVPSKMDQLNQIWQVGSSVTNGHPNKHAFGQPNLSSKGTVDLAATSPTISTVATTNSTSNGTSTSSGNSTGGGYRIKELNMGYRIGFFVAVACVLGF